MSATVFYRGQQLGRNDLNIFLVNAANTPINAAEISYALYDFTTGQEVLVGPQDRNPLNPSVGEYFASFVVPLDANLGGYRIRWTIRELIGAPAQQVVQEFSVIDKAGTSSQTASLITGGATNASVNEMNLMGRLRILLRDNAPDAHYRFRPPTHEQTIQQFNRVFGYIWDDAELQEFIARSLDMISASPPRTAFQNVDQMMLFRPEWRTLLLTGAMMYALQALRLNWAAEEFSYSIGGVSLDLEKSSKYESAYQGASELFDKQLEKAKATVNFVKGLQQPKYGLGVRSSFGPFLGHGQTGARRFVGF